jgi:hypothetical protein
MTDRSYRRYAVVLLVAASALHAYEGFVLSRPPSLGWFAWLMLPYGWCVLALLLGTRGRAATVGAAVALAWDITTHFSVFVGNHGSTAALALIFDPLWSGLLFVPASMLLTGFLTGGLAGEGRGESNSTE